MNGGPLRSAGFALLHAHSVQYAAVDVVAGGRQYQRRVGRCVDQILRCLQRNGLCLGLEVSRQPDVIAQFFLVHRVERQLQAVDADDVAAGRLNLHCEVDGFAGLQRQRIIIHTRLAVDVDFDLLSPFVSHHHQAIVLIVVDVGL